MGEQGVGDVGRRSGCAPGRVCGGQKLERHGNKEAELLENGVASEVGLDWTVGGEDRTVKWAHDRAPKE